MITKISKNDSRKKIHSRIRKRLQGTTERPRLNIYRSVEHIYAQIIDDSKGTTVVSASSLELGKLADGKTHVSGGNVVAAKQVGKSIAERAKQSGIQKVVFDRGGYLYHGRIKALAEAARAAGLEF
jgi:large subunit ribosomal protein L18